MADDFKIIAITLPEDVENESEKIVKLLDSGVDYVHIRKPGKELRQVEKLLKEIPEEYHSRLKLHDHFSLLDRFGLGGVHLNSRNRIAPENARSVSCSCHAVEEIVYNNDKDYVFLSPIFDSISKKDYKSKFNIDELTPYLSLGRVVALGGVTTGKLSLLKEKGFYGAAMMGSIW